MSTTENTESRVEQVARAMRRSVVEMCRERGGYVGQGLALSDVVSALYFSELRRDDSGELLDRFVLSNGHDAMAVYAALAELGVYDRSELSSYGADGSRIEPSPVEGTLGFEITAGSLGQGLSQAVGIALGERLRERDVRVYCLASDGELQEGQMWEAAMAAAHYGLDNLVLIIDNNHLQADGVTDQVMSVEPVPEKFMAFGWGAERLDGNDIKAILDAFQLASALGFSICTDS